MKTDAGSTRDHVESEREGVAPSITFGLGTDHRLTLAHYYLWTHNVPDYGVPYFQFRPLDVPKDRFYGTTDDFEDNRTNISTASYEFSITPESTLRTVLRHADYTRDLWAVAPRLAAGATETTIANGTAIVNRNRQARGGEEETWTSQTDFTTRFSTGAFEHEALIGLELLDEDAGRWSYNAIPGAAPPTTVGDPDASPVLPASYGNRVKNNIVTYEGFTWAPYVQDMVQILPGWKVFAGARWDELSADYSTGAEVDYGEWSYRAGVSHQPTDFQHYYFAWSDSFNPTSDLYQFTPSTTVFPAERSRTLELGAKWELFEGDLSLRTSVYRTEKAWERNTDIETAANNPLLTRERHTDGFELEGAGRITDRWELFAGLALMKARIDEARPNGNPNVEGLRPRNAPGYTYNVWTTYELDRNWKVGGGVEAKGERLAYGIGGGTAAITPNKVPSYTRWDAMLAYEQPRYEIKLNVLNAFDKRYYESVYENGGHVLPGTGRVVQLVTELKF
jgi:catecholate siderophore receptor